jgi:anti-sigma factor RsiW
MLHVSHHRFRHAIDPYADGELDEQAAWTLSRHLEQCEGCRHDLVAILAIKRSLARLATREPPTLAAARLRRWAACLHA